MTKAVYKLLVAHGFGPCSHPYCDPVSPSCAINHIHLKAAKLGDMRIIHSSEIADDPGGFAGDYVPLEDVQTVCATAQGKAAAAEARAETLQQDRDDSRRFAADLDMQLIEAEAARDALAVALKELKQGENMTEQIPTIGRIVHYKLTAADAEQIQRRRTTSTHIAERMNSRIVNPQGGHDVSAWPVGAQAHIGNDVKEGDVFPMLIVKPWGDTPTSAVNGQVFLDGNDVLWATSRTVGEQPGQFAWPVRG